jgi:hypothetical protein
MSQHKCKINHTTIIAQLYVSTSVIVFLWSLFRGIRKMRIRGPTTSWECESILGCYWIMDGVLIKLAMWNVLLCHCDLRTPWSMNTAIRLVEMAKICATIIEDLIYGFSQQHYIDIACSPVEHHRKLHKIYSDHRYSQLDRQPVYRRRMEDLEASRCGLLSEDAADRTKQVHR